MLLAKLNDTKKPPKGGLGYYLSTENNQSTLDSSCLITKPPPYTSYLCFPVVLVLSEGDKSFCLEMYQDQLRVLGDSPILRTKCSPLVLKTDYARYGLSFVFQKTSLAVPKQYKYIAAFSHPTLDDFASLGVIRSLFENPIPCDFCTKKYSSLPEHAPYGVDFTSLK